MRSKSDSCNLAPVLVKTGPWPFKDIIAVSGSAVRCEWRLPLYSVRPDKVDLQIRTPDGRRVRRTNLVPLDEAFAEAIIVLIRAVGQVLLHEACLKVHIVWADGLITFVPVVLSTFLACRGR